MSYPTSGNQTQKSNLQPLVDGFEAMGNVLKQTVGKGVDLLQRQYTEINKQNPKFFPILKKIGVILATALSFCYNPLITLLGFGVGFAFSKGLKVYKDQVNDWFKSASSPMKGLAIAGAVAGAVGLVFTPLLGSFATGVYSGEKFASWMDAKKQQKTQNV